MTLRLHDIRSVDDRILPFPTIRTHDITGRSGLDSECVRLFPAAILAAYSHICITDAFNQVVFYGALSIPIRNTASDLVKEGVPDLVSLRGERID